MHKIVFHIVFAVGVFLSHFGLTAQIAYTLQPELETAKHDTIKCGLLNTMIEEEDDNYTWPKYNDELLSIAEKNLSKPNLSTQEKLTFLKYKSAAYVNKGYLASITGKYTESIAFYTTSLEISKQINDKAGIAECYLSLGSLMMSTFKYQEALDYYKRSLKLAEEINDLIKQSANLNSIGLLYENFGDIPLALQYYLKSLKICEAKNDKREMATVYVNLANLNLNSGDLKKSKEYYETALKLNEGLNDYYGLHFVYNGLAIISQKQGDYLKALELYKIAMENANKVGYIEGITTALNNIGTVYFNLNKYPEALDHYNKSLVLRDSIADKDGMTVSLNCIGTVYFAMKQYNKCIEANKKSLKLAEEIEKPENIKDAALRLYKAYKATNNFQEALRMYELYTKMQDSLINENSRKARLKSQFQLEFDQKERDVKTKAENEKLLMQQKAEQERQQKNSVIYSVMAGLILVLFFSYFLFKSLQKNKKANLIITQQKHLVEEKQREIVDSIGYAKRLQEAILPPQEFVNRYLPDNFIYYQPKDIVAGDFYWAEKVGEKFFIAAADSTGHGVPGAMVSVVCSNALNRTIKEFKLTETGTILDKTRELVLETFEKSASEVKDGMDISLLCIDAKNKTVFWSGANNPLWYIQNNEWKEIKGDKQPIGKTDHPKPFTTHQLDYKTNSTFYLFTDGFADQFGGPKGKKFKYKQLNELLLANHKQSLLQQQQTLKQNFDNWKGDLEQVDDVTVIGVKLV